MRSPAKTPQFWIICFVITVNASWLQAQSFDTLVLKNVEKKYVTGSLISMQKDYIVYFRQNLPNGPEFRMSKQNVRWIITKDNEILEVSDKFDPSYRHIDGTNTPTEVIKSEQTNPNNSSSNKGQGNLSVPNQRSVITLQNNSNQVYQFSGSTQPQNLSIKNDFLIIGFSLGAGNQQFRYISEISTTSMFSYAFELGYAGFREKLFLNPTLRVIRKGVTLSYSDIDNFTNVQFKERHSLAYIDLALSIGRVLRENKGRRSVIYIGPYYGFFVGGNAKAEYKGTVTNSQGVRQSVSGEIQASIKPGDLGPGSQLNTIYRRRGELGVQVGLKLPVNNQVTFGPAFFLGISDIYPRIIDNSIINRPVPEIRSSAFHLSFSILL
jgi:hypothetical protein